MSIRLSGLAASLVACVLLATACGGRAHVDDNTGVAFRRVFEAQKNVKPKASVANFTADDVRRVMANRQARLAIGKGEDLGAAPGFTSAAGASPMSSMSMDMGGTLGEGDAGGTPAAGGGGPIRLQAK